MTHCTEDDLVLHYYGEAPDGASIERHLQSCGDCAAIDRALQRALHLVSASEVPARGADYGDAVWRRLRGRLDRPPRRWWEARPPWRPVEVAAAVAALIVVAFVAGRSLSSPARPDRPPVAADGREASERVRLAAIGDHLERSERVLLDLMNTDGDRVDLSAEQRWSADLLDANRLYRDASARDGDALVAGVLDDLERSLIEIVHGPTAPTRAELDEVRGRLDAAALLFKVRVLASELHEREIAPVHPGKAT